MEKILSRALLSTLTDEPVLLNTSTGENGALFVKKSKLYVTLEPKAHTNAYKNMPDSYEGRFTNSYIKIIHPRIISGKVWNSQEGETSQQVTLTYDYCVVSTVKKALSDNEVLRIDLTFPVLFHRPKEELNEAVSASNKSLETIVRTTSKNTLLSVKFQKPISVEDAVRYRTRFERFFTSFSETLIQAETMELTVEESSLLLITPDRPIQPKVQKVKSTSIRPIQETTDLLLAYVTNFEQIGYATHLHASYVEYGDRKIYLESRFSVLFAGIDSIYSKLAPPPNDKEKTRILEYDNFILTAGKLETTKGNKNIMKFLKKESTKLAYTSPVSFQAKLNTVYDYAGAEKMESSLSERVNTLRNNIAHGNDYNFDEFITEWVNPKTNKTYPAITGKDIENMSYTLWRAIKKLAKQ